MRAWLSGVVGGGRGRNSLIYTGPEGKPGGESRFHLSITADVILKYKVIHKKKKHLCFVLAPRAFPHPLRELHFIFENKRVGCKVFFVDNFVA